MAEAREALVAVHDPNLGSRFARWLPLPLAAFLTANSAVWLQRNLLTFPPTWDQANYLAMSLRFWHAFQDAGLRGLAEAVTAASDVWPPLFPLTTAAVYGVLGESRLVAHLSNGLYLLLLLIAVQVIASAGYGRRAGVLAAVLACGFSDVIRLSRDYLLDFPAAALLAVGMAAFVRSGELRRRGGSVAFGAAVGLTALTKTMTGVFFIAPVVRALWRTRRSEDALAVRRHLALALAIAILLASAWWLPHFLSAIGYLFYYGVGSGAVPYATGGRAVLGLRNLTYYFWVLVNNAISFPAALVFALLLARRIWLRARKGVPFAESWLDGVLWTWIVAGYVVLTLVPNKGGDRYALFILPPLAALYGGWLSSLPSAWLRRGMTALALLAVVFNYAAQTWGFASLPRLVVLHPVVFLQQDYPHLVWMREAIPLSAQTPWPMDQVGPEVVGEVAARRTERVARDLQSLATLPTQDPEAVLRAGYRTLLGREPQADASDHLANLRSGRQTAEAFYLALTRSEEFRRRRARVVVVPDHPVVNATTLNYYAERARLRMVYARVEQWPTPGESLETFDAAILKDGGTQGAAFFTRAAAALTAALQAPASGYRLVRSWPCPDGSRVVLLVRG